MSRLEYTVIVKTRLKEEGFDPKFDNEDVEFVGFAYENRAEISPSICAEAIINYRSKKTSDREVTIEARVVKQLTTKAEHWSPFEENATEIYRQADIIEA